MLLFRQKRKNLIINLSLAAIYVYTDASVYQRVKKYKHFILSSCLWWYWYFYLGKSGISLGKGWVRKLFNASKGGARGVMVIVVGNGHGATSSNPGLDWLTRLSFCSKYYCVSLTIQLNICLLFTYS